MALHIHVLRLSVADRPILHAIDDGLDDVAVLDRLAVRGPPAVRFPLIAPISHAFDAVFAVGEDLDVAVDGCNVECTLDGGQLGTLVGLA